MTNVIRSKKICSKDDCNYPLVARGFCRYHYNSDYLAPKQALKAPKSYTIPKITAKRRSQVTKYHSERKVFIQAERDFNPRKEIYCIFCDEIIYEMELQEAAELGVIMEMEEMMKNYLIQYSGTLHITFVMYINIIQ